MNTHSKQGYTLLESLITLAIISIVSSFAIPGYSSFIDSQLRSTTLNNLHHTIALARSEAIKRRSDIALCPSTDSKTCSNSKDYSQGWIIFVDEIKNKTLKRNLSEPLIDVHKTNFSTFTLLSNRKNFIFRSYGKRNTNGTFILCPGFENTNKIHKYQSFILSFTGRPRVTKGIKAEHVKICT